jgi:hypothetical protein
MSGIMALSRISDETRVLSQTSATLRGRPSGRALPAVAEGKPNRRGKPKKLNILEMERRYTQDLVVSFVDQSQAREYKRAPGFKDSSSAARGATGGGGEVGGALWRRAFVRGP